MGSTSFVPCRVSASAWSLTCERPSGIARAAMTRRLPAGASVPPMCHRRLRRPKSHSVRTDRFVVVRQRPPVSVGVRSSPVCVPKGTSPSLYVVCGHGAIVPKSVGSDPRRTLATGYLMTIGSWAV